MKLFAENGYLDFDVIVKHPSIFKLIYGGRGTGKTYGALKYCREHNKKFIYLRRLATQADIVSTPDFNPFNKLNSDLGWTVQTYSIPKVKSTYYFCNTKIDENGKPVADGEPVGILAALSTFANLRGINCEDVEIIILDEFIPELTEKPIKDEANAIFNAYETINRNRELSGLPPAIFIFLANSNRIDNPLFMELKLVTSAEKLRTSGKELLDIKDRRMILVDLFKSKISEQKSKTALYDLTRGTEFYDMSIKNRFMNEEKSRIGTKNIKEYRPIVTVGEITIYKHKSRKEYYCTKFKSGSPDTYGAGSKSLMRFRRHFLYLWQAYMRNDVIFEEYVCEILFDRYFNT